LALDQAVGVAGGQGPGAGGAARGTEPHMHVTLDGSGCGDGIHPSGGVRGVLRGLPQRRWPSGRPTPHFRRKLLQVNRLGVRPPLSAAAMLPQKIGPPPI